MLLFRIERMTIKENNSNVYKNGQARYRSIFSIEMNGLIAAIRANPTLYTSSNLIISKSVINDIKLRQEQLSTFCDMIFINIDNCFLLYDHDKELLNIMQVSREDYIILIERQETILIILGRLSNILKKITNELENIETVLSTQRPKYKRSMKSCHSEVQTKWRKRY